MKTFNDSSEFIHTSVNWLFVTLKHLTRSSFTFSLQFKNYFVQCEKENSFNLPELNLKCIILSPYLKKSVASSLDLCFL